MEPPAKEAKPAPAAVAKPADAPVVAAPPAEPVVTPEEPKKKETGGGWWNRKPKAPEPEAKDSAAVRTPAAAGPEVVSADTQPKI